MATKLQISVSAFVLSLALATVPAFAQQAGGVKIGGDAKINASGENITTQAEQGSTAVTSVGRVMGNTDVKGDVNISASAKNVSTKATGSSCAETAIGVVGSGPCPSK